MAKMTPEQEAAYALDYGVDRADLPKAAQVEYETIYAAVPRSGRHGAGDRNRTRMASLEDR